MCGALFDLQVSATLCRNTELAVGVSRAVLVLIPSTHRDQGQVLLLSSSSSP